MTEGLVKWFDPMKGYGFITYHGDEEIFVHFTNIVAEGFKTLKQNQRVRFEIKEGHRGLQAANVEVMSD